MDYDPAVTLRDKPRRASLSSFDNAITNYRRGSISSLHTIDPQPLPVARRDSVTGLPVERSQNARRPSLLSIRKRSSTIGSNDGEVDGTSAAAAPFYPTRRISLVPPVTGGRARSGTTSTLTPLREIAESPAPAQAQTFSSLGAVDPKSLHRRENGDSSDSSPQGTRKEGEHSARRDSVSFCRALTYFSSFASAS